MPEGAQPEDRRPDGDQPEGVEPDAASTVVARHDAHGLLAAGMRPAAQVDSESLATARLRMLALAGEPEAWIPDDEPSYVDGHTADSGVVTRPTEPVAVGPVPVAAGRPARVRRSRTSVLILLPVAAVVVVAVGVTALVAVQLTSDRPGSRRPAPRDVRTATATVTGEVTAEVTPEVTVGEATDVRPAASAAPDPFTAGTPPTVVPPSTVPTTAPASARTPGTLDVAPAAPTAPPAAHHIEPRPVGSPPRAPQHRRPPRPKVHASVPASPIQRGGA